MMQIPDFSRKKQKSYEENKLIKSRYKFPKVTVLSTEYRLLFGKKSKMK